MKPVDITVQDMSGMDVTFSVKTPDEVTIHSGTNKVEIRKNVLLKAAHKIRTAHKDPEDFNSFDDMFKAGMNAGYDSGKNDAINNIENLTVFSDENRDLGDGYQLGFELGYCRGLAEFHSM